MADPKPLRLTRRTKAAAPIQEDIPQEEQSSMLSKAGGAALSGLHTLGSILSTPSRALHGTANYLTGGEGGFGNLNPLDSTGGIEGSQHLIRAGLLSKNDPTKWEWGDLGRGLADAALDPTTYIAGLGLTGKGAKAAKLGTQAAGRVGQIAAGERALLTAGLPFAKKPLIEIGTGPGVAKALQTIGRKTGVTRAAQAIKTSLPARLARAGFDYTVQGMTHPTLQKYVPESVKNMFKANKATEADVVRGARSLAGHNPDEVRMSLEGVTPSAVKGGYAPHPSTTTAQFDEPHVMMHLSPQKLSRALGDRLPEYGGHLDETLAAGSQIHAPILHLTPEGGISGGGLATKEARKLARQAYRAQQNSIRERLANTISHLPEPPTPPARVVDQIAQAFPGFHNTELIPFREIQQQLGYTPSQVVEAMRREIPDGFSLHNNDFPQQIIQQGSQADYHWVPRSEGSHGTADIPFIGASLRPEVGRQLAAEQAQAASANANRLVPNPEHLAIQQELSNLHQNKRAFIDLEHQRNLEQIHGQHGADEGLESLAHIASLNEPGMGVMVPKSQADAFRRQFGQFENTNRTGPLDHPEIANFVASNADNLNRQLEAGVGSQGALEDIHRHFPRRASITGEDVAAGAINRGSKVLPGKTAEDVGRKTFLKGNAEGTVGTNKILGDADVHAAIESGGWKAAVPLIEQKYGHIIERIGQTPKHKAAVAAAAKRADSLANKLAQTTAKLEEYKVAGQTAKIGPAIDRMNSLKTRHAAAVAAHEAAQIAGVDRVKALAKYAAAHPELKGQKLFGNDPLADYKLGSLSANKKVSMSSSVYRTIKDHLNGGDQSVKLGNFLKSGGFNVRKAAEHISGQTFDEPGSLKAFLNGATIDSKLAAQLQSLSPKFTSPEAVNEAKQALSTGMAWWKGLTLAFPASRARDAVGGVVQNLLHGWADPRFIVKDVRQLLDGKIVKRSYEHVPEVQEWLAKSQLPWTPENQTEALRQLVAVHLPGEHNALADVPVGQIGAGIDQLTSNVVGKTPTSTVKQFITDPLKTAVGMGDNGAAWLGKNEPGASLLQRAKTAAAQPFTGVRGVGDTAETTFAPVKASELVSAASDAHNRVGPFLQQLHGGTAADVAGEAVNRAQVNYDPQTFTAVERAIKNNIIPFWSFNSRMLPETARQLSDFGSPTSQLIKGINRAQGQDPSLPDYTLAGTAIPLPSSEDGTKKVLGGLGLMHEGAASQLGLLSALAGGDPRAGRALGYDTLGMLNPLIGVPLQRITGQSFFQRGTPLENLDPTTGRLISNVGESLGLRDKDAGPVRYPGARAVDAVLGATPFGRLASQARTIADPRKDIGTKLADVLSGVKISDVSPGQQLNTLQKRAEDLAKSEGAFESRMVGFSRDEIAKLAETNPELAARQMELQGLITNIKRRKAASRKMKEASEETTTLKRKKPKL